MEECIVYILELYEIVALTNPVNDMLFYKIVKF